MAMVAVSRTFFRFRQALIHAFIHVFLSGLVEAEMAPSSFSRTFLIFPTNCETRFPRRAKLAKGLGREDRINRIRKETRWRQNGYPCIGARHSCRFNVMSSMCARIFMTLPAETTL